MYGWEKQKQTGDILFTYVLWTSVLASEIRYLSGPLLLNRRLCWCSKYCLWPRWLVFFDRINCPGILPLPYRTQPGCLTTLLPSQCDVGRVTYFLCSSFCLVLHFHEVRLKNTMWLCSQPCEHINVAQGATPSPPNTQQFSDITDFHPRWS